MATITILKSELDEMDRLIHDQKRIIQDQQALLTRVLEILKPWIDASKNPAGPPRPAPVPASGNIDQLIRSEK
jgi:hypothetical protein